MSANPPRPPGSDRARYGPAEFQRDTGVSRETLQRLCLYAAELEKWNARINLVGRGSIPLLWHRHILDAAQIAPLVPAAATTLADIGSGAGFPGLVLAILGHPETVHLVEADTRKCIFLREAARLTGTPVTIHNCRAEALRRPPVNVVTARAVATLDEMLAISAGFSSVHTIFIFPKGSGHERELTAARHRWRVDVTKVKSRTDPNGTLLVVSGVSRVNERQSG